MTTAKMGRPEIGPQLKIRFPEDLIVQVDGFAAQAGVTRSEWIRRAVRRAQIAATCDRIAQRLRALTEDQAERILRVAADCDREVRDHTDDDELIPLEIADRDAHSALRQDWDAAAAWDDTSRALDDITSQQQRLAGEPFLGPWLPAGKVAQQAALAVHARELITADQYETLTHVWAQVIGL